MVETNNLSAEDAALIHELAPILGITFVNSIGESERKFYIETTKGEKWMLRITAKGNDDWLGGKCLYEYMATVGTNVSLKASEGFLEGGELVYELWTWIDGEALNEVLPRMSQAERFEIGKKFGEAARKIHSLPPLGYTRPWSIHCKEKVDNVIASFEGKTNTKAENQLIKYLLDNQELLDNRPTTFIKGDWNTGNLMLTPDGRIWLIDCGAISGDPWSEFWEFNGDDVYFNTGEIKGYFGGEPPTEYFPLLCYYIALGTLEWYPHTAEMVVGWFDDMRNPVPTWYLKDYR